MTLRQLRDSLTSVPFNTLLGIGLHRVHRDGITIDCRLRNDLRNNAGVAVIYQDVVPTGDARLMGGA